MTCRGDAYENNAAVTVTDPAVLRSVFNRADWKTLGACTDGTSNTIAAGESVAQGTLGRRDNRVKSALPTVDRITLRNNPITQCLAVVEPGDTILKSTFVQANSARNPGEFDTWRGAPYTCGNPAFTGFCTVLPPNSPHCASTTTSATGHSRNVWGVHSVTSYHPGGVNISLFDGSSRFISEAVNATTAGLGPRQNNDGPSAYGVWGAMGSINGGESTSL